MKAYPWEVGRSKGIAPLILNFDTKCEWSVSSIGRYTLGLRFPPIPIKYLPIKFFFRGRNNRRVTLANNVRPRSTKVENVEGFMSVHRDKFVFIVLTRPSST